MKIVEAYLNQGPLDHFEMYAKKTKDWIRDGDTKNRNQFPEMSFSERIKAYQMALDYLKSGVPLFDESDLRNEPHLYIEPNKFTDEDCYDGDLIYWFIFKENNNGTTHKIGIS